MTWRKWSQAHRMLDAYQRGPGVGHCSQAPGDPGLHPQRKHLPPRRHLPPRSPTRHQHHNLHHRRHHHHYHHYRHHCHHHHHHHHHHRRCHRFGQPKGGLALRRFEKVPSCLYPREETLIRSPSSICTKISRDVGTRTVASIIRPWASKSSPGISCHA